MPSTCVWRTDDKAAIQLVCRTSWPDKLLALPCPKLGLPPVRVSPVSMVSDSRRPRPEWLNVTRAKFLCPAQRGAFFVYAQSSTSAWPSHQTVLRRALHNFDCSWRSACGPLHPLKLYVIQSNSQFAARKACLAA
jgi:hypothetical protein